MGELIAFPVSRRLCRQRSSASLLETWRAPSAVARRQTLLLWLSALIASCVLVVLQLVLVPR